jgi:two-component system phosphate regulon sensor histidine kinase PhoR
MYERQSEKGTFAGMQRFKNTRLLPLLMGLTILIIGGFQVYWLNKTFEREERTLEMRSNILFRETVLSLQASKLKLDRVGSDSSIRVMLPKGKRVPLSMEIAPDQKVVSLVNAMREQARDSLTVNKEVFYKRREGKPLHRRERMMQFLYDVDSLQDSIRVMEISNLYTRRMNAQGLSVPFAISRVDTAKEERVYNEVTLGFARPITYRLELGNTFPFLLRRISAAILFSVFLIGVTLLSFSLLYRNLLRQQRLAIIKNDFISNITHELKTPIATVSVAIEALRSFNAHMDPARQKEYLDISANELQRLSLLVDKVLKLSMFEKREVELQYEMLDMNVLVQEVAASMRLQFEKHGAEVTTHSEGETTLEGDRLHLVSVIFNLLDNALKYSSENPRIGLLLKGEADKVVLEVSDSGIGIPAEYRDRIFEKFFRVPTGNLHNAKGYGLGLSYVSHVVKKHRGTIRVESSEGQGSRFVITLPKNKA